MHDKPLAEMRVLEERMGREPAPEERIHAMIRAYVATARRSPGVYRFVTRPSDGLNHFLDSVTRIITTFLPAGTPSPQIWATGAVGFVERAVDTWMNDLEAADGASTTLTSDQLVTHLVTWLMKGLHA
ncbi:hypothetical protein [Brachybacterium sp. GPGPB12]|uniref:hypothetical protein n=1 Tax=Brachybacterium sp. GPGPB12 TaxID=3023517 RepID=UPI0031345997